MTSVWDENLGNITNKIKEQGQWNNTLIIVASDNGGAIRSNGPSNNYPLKGGKFSPFQGGVRTIAAVGGGFLEESVRGTVSDGYIHISDWYSTFCYLAGVDPTDHHDGIPEIDSINVWDLFSGQSTNKPRTMVPIEMIVDI